MQPASPLTVIITSGSTAGSCSLFFVTAKTVAFSVKVLNSSITAPSALVSLHSLISLSCGNVIIELASNLISFHVRLRFFLTLISFSFATMQLESP